MPSFTEQQQAVIRAMRAGDSIAVIARAGSGKTTTAVEGMQAMPGKAIALAFNKRNADELKAKVPPNVQALTLNGLGHRVWGEHISKRLQVNADKCADWLKQAGLPKEEGAFAAALTLIRLAKAYGIPPGILQQPEPDMQEWAALAAERDIDSDAFDAYAPFAFRCLQWSVQEAWKGLIDFDDQLYMPVLFRARFPSTDAVITDEAQDLSGLQHQMVARIKAKQRVIIGDPAQAIYAFRGASSNSFFEMQEMFGLQEKPLTVSFRCPKAVIREAQRYVPDIEWAAHAAEGSVQSVAPHDVPHPATIICRYNGPLVKRAFALIRAGKPVDYLGRDFISGLQALNKKCPTPEALGAWVNEQVKKSKSKGAKARAEDRYNSLMTLHDSAREGGGTVESILKNILMQAKAGNATVLSTVHKAKGMEWRKVCFLNYNPDDAQEEGQEGNILYVGVTRAQDTLLLTAPQRRWE